MSYRYLALLSNDHEEPGDVPPPGMLSRNLGRAASAPVITLFTSESTPAFELPDGGMLIGHLFSRTGVAIIDSSQLPTLECAAKIRQHVLHNCWGEYLMIQPSPDGHGVSVTRSPSVSGGLPCIYSYRDGAGFITSDISLAIHFGRYQKRVDWDYIARFLTYPFLRTQCTALVDINELLPGELLQLQGPGIVTEQAWTPWQFVATANRYVDFHEAANSVRTAVSTAVQTLAAVDESVLLELSGGLDSSIVAACLRDSAARIICSTLFTSIPGADERLYASAAANYLGADLRSVDLAVESSMFSFIDAADPVRPSVGPLQYGIDTVMRDSADHLMVNSAFSGAGGDTIFSYLRTAAPAVDAFKQRGISTGLLAVQNLATLHQCTAWRALHLTLRKALRKPSAPYPPDTSFLLPSKLGGAPLDHPWFHAPAGALPGDRERIFELAGNQVFMDYAPRRTSRFFRMPLLSQPVVEACLRVPSWMWITGGQNRAVARAAFADLLPANILSRRSKGTLISYLGEVYQHNKGQMLKYLLSGHLCSRGILDSRALQNFVNADLPPRDRSFARVLDLCRVENWIRQQD